MWKKNVLVLMILLVSGLVVGAQGTRWTEKEAADWYAKQPWLVGSNYNPADAINELEMWQADYFYSKQVVFELGRMDDIGLNTIPGFLLVYSWLTAAADHHKMNCHLL